MHCGCWCTGEDQQHKPYVATKSDVANPRTSLEPWWGIIPKWPSFRYCWGVAEGQQATTVLISGCFYIYIYIILVKLIQRHEQFNHCLVGVPEVSHCFDHHFQTDMVGRLSNVYFSMVWQEEPTIVNHKMWITIWLFNIAMENDPFIDDFPMKTSIDSGFSMAMSNNQMVELPARMV